MLRRGPTRLELKASDKEELLTYASASADRSGGGGGGASASSGGFRGPGKAEENIIAGKPKKGAAQRVGASS